MNENIFDGVGVIEEKVAGTKKDGEIYWKFKILLKGAENAVFYSLWDVDAGKAVNKGDTVKLFWTEKEGQGQRGKVTYRNINSIGTLEKYEPSMANQSDQQLASQAPPESMKEVVQEEVGRTPQALSTSESIVRQVLYKCAAEVLAPDTSASFLNRYVKELEKGFYEG